ncbi:hypothetical protein [Streptomyces sp. NBC_00996]|uniref:hypothetical protein n=1 Tax=Streptomyces sp. NBC_00996 TaxID=2903710 RepID=UPI00386F7199
MPLQPELRRAGGGAEDAAEKAGEEVVQVVRAQGVHLGRAPADLPDRVDCGA